MEKLDYLIDYLLRENIEIDVKKLPTDINEKKNLYRSLCNIRAPKPISEEYLKLENEYLQEELQKKEITEIANVKTIQDNFPNSSLKYKDKICLWQGDITTLKIDAIVNAANSQGLGCFLPCHKCIDNQIHTFAGIELRLECNKIMKEKKYELRTSETIITKAYNLPSKYIIHTVGPIIYDELTDLKRKQLADCYINSLELAIKNEIRTIAFPCISTGEFRFPKEEACKIAILAIEEFLKEHRDSFDKIVFNVYGKDDYEIYERNIR